MVIETGLKESREFFMHISQPAFVFFRNRANAYLGISLSFRYSSLGILHDLFGWGDVWVGILEFSCLFAFVPDVRSCFGYEYISIIVPYCTYVIASMLF
jgi:hypothetical protein